MRSPLKKLFVASLAIAALGLGGIFYFETPGDHGVSFKLVNDSNQGLLTWVSARDCSQLIAYRHETTLEEAVPPKQALDYADLGEGKCIEVATTDRRIVLARRYTEGVVVTASAPFTPLTDPIPLASELPTRPPGVSSPFGGLSGPVAWAAFATLGAGFAGLVLAFVLSTAIGIFRTYASARGNGGQKLRPGWLLIGGWVTGRHAFATGLWIIVAGVAAAGVYAWQNNHQAVHFTVTNNSAQRLLTWYRSGGCRADGRGAAVDVGEEIVVPGQTVDYSNGDSPGCIYIVTSDRRLVLSQQYRRDATVSVGDPLPVSSVVIPKASPYDTIGDTTTRGEAIILGFIFGGLILCFLLAPAVAFVRKVRQDNWPRPTVERV